MFATEHTQSLIPVGAKVDIELDVQPKDKYGRTLASMYGFLMGGC
jgi:endonuclease YncB( thermonuclease family)